MSLAKLNFQESERNYSSMSANSEWLKAYEAQKSKALEQLSAAKSDAGLIHSNSPGLSGPSKKRRVFHSWAYTSPNSGNGYDLSNHLIKDNLNFIILIMIIPGLWGILGQWDILLLT